LSIYACKADWFVRGDLIHIRLYYDLNKLVLVRVSRSRLPMCFPSIFSSSGTKFFLIEMSYINTLTIVYTFRDLLCASANFYSCFVLCDVFCNSEHASICKFMANTHSSILSREGTYSASSPLLAGTVSYRATFSSLLP
jgi:hypothetical protein